METLQKKLKNRDATVGVIGLGYVGLPLAVLFAEAGFRVLGFDTDPSKGESLKQGVSYIQDVSDERVRKSVISHGVPRAGEFGIAPDNEYLSKCDAIVICVPTPLAKTRDPDLSFIIASARVVRRYLREGQLIVLESTTYPGTTRELVLPILTEWNATGDADDRAAFEVGKQFFLAFSPERVDPGNKQYSIRNTPKVMGGITDTCVDVAQALYGAIVERTVKVSSTDAAEMTKLLENTFRLINIGLVNEFSLMCNRLNVDVWEVIDAAATKPFGFIPFYPGPGLGGHCIPVDPHYLSWKLRLHDYRARFIELASDVNSHMPAVVVERVNDALNGVRKSIHGARVGILGVAYKKDIEDVRESPALDVLALLKRRGAELSYSDPFVPTVELLDGELLHSSQCTVDWLKRQDCVVIVTDHSQYDMPTIVKHARLLVDTRNHVARSGLAAAGSGKVVKL